MIRMEVVQGERCDICGYGVAVIGGQEIVGVRLRSEKTIFVHRQPCIQSLTDAISLMRAYDKFHSLDYDDKEND